MPATMMEFRALHIHARTIDRHAANAARAISQYSHTRAYAAALRLAEKLLSFDVRGCGEFTYEDASRLIAMVASAHTPAEVITRMVMLAFEMRERQDYGVQFLYRYEIGLAFIKLAPAKLRGPYQQQRVVLCVAEIVERTIWKFCFGLVSKIRQDEAERAALVEIVRTIAEEKPCDY